MRPAALEAARPEPSLVGQQHGDAAFALAVEDEQRAVAVAQHDRLALRFIDVDRAEPASPGRRLFGGAIEAAGDGMLRSEEHTSELQSLMRISYAVFCLTKKTQEKNT